MIRLCFFLFLIFAVQTLSVFAQQTIKKPGQTATPAPAESSANGFNIKRTSVYAELFVRKIEAQADLQTLVADYTEESPEVREIQLRIKVIERAIRNLETMSGESLLKLTPTVGRLLARKLEAEAELKVLSEIYTDEYPAVKKAKIRYAVFNEEYKKSLQ